jgi:hypothetical protein
MSYMGTPAKCSSARPLGQYVSVHTHPYLGVLIRKPLDAHVGEGAKLLVHHLMETQVWMAGLHSTCA